jgi:hypothetical protein
VNRIQEISLLANHDGQSFDDQTKAIQKTIKFKHVNALKLIEQMEQINISSLVNHATELLIKSFTASPNSLSPAYKTLRAKAQSLGDIEALFHLIKIGNETIASLVKNQAAYQFVLEQSKASGKSIDQVIVDAIIYEQNHVNDGFSSIVNDGVNHQ